MVQFSETRSAPSLAPLLSFAVAKIKCELKLPDEANRGIDDALADALCSAQVREQVAVLPLARRRETPGRLQPDVKLDALEARWIAARKPTPKAQAAMNTAVRYFKSYIGDVGIGEIKPNDLPHPAHSGLAACVRSS